MTEESIKTKFETLHGMLFARENFLLNQLSQFHRIKKTRVREQSRYMKKWKKYLKLKLVESQTILENYQTHWQQEYNYLLNENIHNNKINFSINTL